jgi:glutathione S-transferase
MNRLLDVATSFGSSAIRLGNGIAAGAVGSRPERTLQLYEFEGCPYCRKVREALTVLDLEAEVYPCPKGGPRFREEVKARGGKYLFPYLVDPNTGREMYESDEIVRYLFRQYGRGDVPFLMRPSPLNDAGSGLACLPRAGQGVRYRAAKPPEKMLELYSFEGSPFCRIARECLSSLEIPYLLHNVGKGSPSRDAFVARSGRMMVPYLVDPNTGVAMFESADIVRYLERTYAV